MQRDPAAVCVTEVNRKEIIAQEPIQPKNIRFPASSARNLRFQAAWFERDDCGKFLEYSVCKDAAYCFACRCLGSLVARFPKAALCPFHEQSIKSLSGLKHVVTEHRSIGKVVLDIDKPIRPPYDRRSRPWLHLQQLSGGEDSGKQTRKRIDVRVGWPTVAPPPPSNSVYLMTNDNPKKAFIPGYSGWVPRFLDKGNKTFWRATHDAVNEFTDSLLTVTAVTDDTEDCGRSGSKVNGNSKETAGERKKVCHVGCHVPYRQS